MHPHREELSSPDRDLAARRPVWEAWSELYLDTDPTPPFLDRCVERLAASPYSPHALRLILWREVHPVCCWNLLAPAGVWDGFDVAELEEAILRRRRGWLAWPTALHPLRHAIEPRAESLLTLVAGRRGRPA